MFLHFCEKEESKGRSLCDCGVWRLIRKEATGACWKCTAGATKTCDCGACRATTHVRGSGTRVDLRNDINVEARLQEKEGREQ